MIRILGLSASLALGLVAGGCGARSNVQCEQDSNCDLSSGGVCLTATSGNQWCAYPDPECPTGYRYSDLDVGDGIGGSCVPGNQFTLSVTLGGSGTGTVTSSPDGIMCSSGTCTRKFGEGTLVDLSAVASTGAFLGWSGACGGTGACAVTMNSDQEVVALFGTPGQALWARQFGSSTDSYGDHVRGTAIDSNGDLIVVGEFEGTMPVKSGTDLVSVGADIFVMKMSSATGDVQWAKRFGSAGGDTAMDVAVDSAGNIYVTGMVGGAVDFGGGAWQLQGSRAGYALKLNTAGAYQWAHQIDAGGNIMGSAIALRGTKVVLTGEFDNTINVDGASKSTVGDRDIFVASFLASNGTTDWVKTFGSTGEDHSWELAIDANGSVIVAGSFVSTINFGGGTLTASGRDAFVLKLSGTTGATQTSFKFGGANYDDALAVATDATNNIYVTGEFTGTIDFGCANTVTSALQNRNDLFFVKFTQAGSCVWAKGFGGTGGTADYGPHGYALAANAAGDIAMTGTFCGTISFGGSTLSAAGSCPNGDVFAVRLAGDGTHLNSVRAGGTGEEFAWDVALAPDGRFFVGGGFRGFSEFGGEAFTSGGYADAFVLGLAPL